MAEQQAKMTCRTKFMSGHVIHTDKKKPYVPWPRQHHEQFLMEAPPCLFRAASANTLPLFTFASGVQIYVGCRPSFPDIHAIFP